MKTRFPLLYSHLHLELWKAFKSELEYGVALLLRGATLLQKALCFCLSLPFFQIFLVNIHFQWCNSSFCIWTKVYWCNDRWMNMLVSFPCNFEVHKWVNFSQSVNGRFVTTSLVIRCWYRNSCKLFLYWAIRPLRVGKLFLWSICI